MDILNLNSVGQAPQPELRAGNAVRKPAPQIPVQQKSEPRPQELQQAVQSINRALQASKSTSLEFSVDRSTRQTVVKVVDKESGDLIRQIPSDAALAIAESIGEFQKGLLLKQEA
jgi:flagellar protein FlaG